LSYWPVHVGRQVFLSVACPHQLILPHGAAYVSCIVDNIFSTPPGRDHFDGFSQSYSFAPGILYIPG